MKTHTMQKTESCPFISKIFKILGPNRSAKVTDHFTCIAVNVTFSITCTLGKKIYIGETGRRLADNSRENLRHLEKKNNNTKWRPNQLRAILIFLIIPTTATLTSKLSIKGLFRYPVKCFE